MSVKLRLPGNALEFEQEFVNEIERNTIYWSFFGGIYVIIMI